MGCPLVVVPGNHDVGDKRTTANAPADVAEGREAFREQWGAPFRSLDLEGYHLVVVDGTLLGATSAEAHEQRAWLEQDLAQDHEHVLVFTHYPPYLHDPEEAEHYDNLGPEARAWFLDLMVRHGVQAVFTGHVHRFFYNQYLGVDLYTLPSAAFTRPEYAALRPVPPSDPEQGRDDPHHLGVTRVELTEDGPRLSVVRAHRPSPAPGPPRRLGTWLRHRLGRVAEVPYGDLDALARKCARDDAPLLHVLDLGLSRIRIPLADLKDEAVKLRLAWLARYGVAVTVFSAGVPTPVQRASLQIGSTNAEWEVVTRPRDHDALAAVLSRWTGPGLTLGRIGKPAATRTGQANTEYHSHFPREGFDPADPALDRLVTEARAGAVARIAFRIADDGDVETQMAAATARAQALGVGATCHVELPFHTEAVPQTNDDLVTERGARGGGRGRSLPRCARDARSAGRQGSRLLVQARSARWGRRSPTRLRGPQAI